jgi:F0F1-type ATP synthase membrane subunit a
MLSSLFILAASNPLEHVLPHELSRSAPFITNQMVMATIAALLMLLIFPALFRRADPNAPTGAKNFFEAILEFLRVEVFRPALKENTERFLPFLWTLFFFILFCNLLGFLPLGEFLGLLSGGRLAHFGGTATGTMSTTVALAVITFFCIHVSGLVQVFRSLRNGTYGHHGHHEEHTSDGTHGHEAAHDLDHMRGDALAADVPGDFRALGSPTGHYADDEHLKRTTHTRHAAADHPNHGASVGKAALLTVPLYLWNFAPHPFKPGPNDSKVMWIPDLLLFSMLLVLELLGAIIKPFALSIRLFANMIAGHIVLAVLAGLILLVPSFAGQLGVAVPVVILSLLVRVLELFVSFLQAYIFVFLATLFLASAVAPEH